MLARPSILFTVLSLSLVATACDEGSPAPDDGADDAGDADADAGDADAGDADADAGDDLDDGEPMSDMPSDEPQADPCNLVGASRECVDAPGTQYCDDIAGEQVWGECLTEITCTPGEWAECFPGDDEFGNVSKECLLVEGRPEWDQNACNTPLVLSFSGSAVEMHASSAAFDIAGAGECLTTDWPAASNPWLAIDLDRNGFVDGGHELFGSGSLLADGRHAKNGFVALSGLDGNRDGKIDAADERFDELLVWRDEDGDKLSLAHELSTLAEMGVQAIDLAYDVREQCDERGNCGRERSRFAFVGSSGRLEVGEVVDIHLACQ